MKRFIVPFIIFALSCQSNISIPSSSFLSEEWKVVSSNSDPLFTYGTDLTFDINEKKCSLNGIYKYHYLINDSLILIEGLNLKQIYRIEYADSILKFQPMFNNNPYPIIFQCITAQNFNQTSDKSNKNKI